MANIHGLGELNRDDPRRYDNVPQQDRGGRGEQDFNICFVPSDEREDPRKYNVFETIQRICCPFCSFLSFVFVISLIDILVYIALIVHSGVVYKSLDRNQKTFLGPCTASLVLFGAKVTI